MVTLIQQDRPDIVLLDVQMPSLSGFDAIDALGAETPEIWRSYRTPGRISCSADPNRVDVEAILRQPL